MYCRLLDEAVRELKGEPIGRAESDITIDINISAYIDESYISLEARKIEMYKKIASIQNRQDAMDIEEELTDRYGEPPVSARNLINIALIKALSADLGFSAVSEKNDAVIFQIGNAKSLNIEAIGKAASKYKRQLLFNAGANPYLLYRLAGISRDKLLDNIKIVLQDLKSFEVQ
jgi:transcription-repair coupling factor (superfamily II helicase)